MPRPTPTNITPVDFGANVRVYDTTVDINTIQSKASEDFQRQETNQFGTKRYAYFFKPGSYNLNMQLGYYTTVHGLGKNPDDVKIKGGLQSLNKPVEGNALNNFWRGVENLQVIPDNKTEPAGNNINTWAVSQATFLRRVHVKGQLWLFDGRKDNSYSSGGFIADSKVDDLIQSGSQQQFLFRNSAWGTWDGGNWNMVFVGNDNPPQKPWPPFTIVKETPALREKPYLIFDTQTNAYAVQVPLPKMGSKGTSWPSDSDPVAPNHPTDIVNTVPISRFYIAKSATDTSSSINRALQSGFNLILTPGVYYLADSLKVIYPDTVVLGLGMATLMPVNGTPALAVADVDGVLISGVLLDAGSGLSPSLMVLGTEHNQASHARNPSTLFDVACRVGGAAPGRAENCVTINSNNVILDNIWIWRADHDDGDNSSVGWTVNPSANGLTVNGDDVFAYGLFVEHFQGFQTLWNGERGTLYFYQSEIPYDVPDQRSWRLNNDGGYPAYKVSSNVKSHTAQGLGVYCFFTNAINLENAIETPTAAGIKMNHMVTFFLNGNKSSTIKHIYNGTGDAVTATQRKSNSVN
jgi:hypothetical protein